MRRATVLASSRPRPGRSNDSPPVSGTALVPLATVPVPLPDNPLPDPAPAPAPVPPVPPEPDPEPLVPPVPPLPDPVTPGSAVVAGAAVGDVVGEVVAVVVVVATSEVEVLAPSSMVDVVDEGPEA